MKKGIMIDCLMLGIGRYSRIVPILLIVLSLCITATIQAKDGDNFIRQGNKLYKDSLYDAAEQKFSKALEVDANDEKAIYNQGNAYYKQKKLEEAIKNFELSAGLMEDAHQKAAAYYNLGNSFFDSQQYDKSIEAYKNALRQNPNDMDTKYNLMVAKKMLENQQNQNQEQDQQNDQNQDQENKDKNQNQQDQQNQNQENNQQQNGENQNQQDQQQNQEQSGKDGNEGEEQQPSGMSPSKLTPEEVKRILESLATDEKNTVKEIIKNEHKAKPNKSDKDW
jgi:tetratricopeptide (TPR) repeat protein